MKKIVTIALVSILILTVASTAFAFGGGFGGGQAGSCLRDTLTADQQLQFDGIIESFRAAMLELRQAMATAREAGDAAAFEEAREARFDLMTQKMEDLAEILPVEYADRFSNCGQGMRNKGWDKGSSGFNSKGGLNQ